MRDRLEEGQRVARYGDDGGRQGVDLEAVARRRGGGPLLGGRGPREQATPDGHNGRTPEGSELHHRTHPEQGMGFNRSGEASQGSGFGGSPRLKRSDTRRPS